MAKYLTGRDCTRACNISMNLKELFRDSKLTRKSLSKITGIPEGRINQYARATKLPTDEDVELIAKAFGCDASYITRIENDPCGNFSEDELYKGDIT